MSPDERLDRRIDSITRPYSDSTVVAVAVRDPDAGFVYSREGDRLFHAASLMKVPVMIEVFRRAERGDFSLEDSLLIDIRFRSIADRSVYTLDRRTDATLAEAQALYERSGSYWPINDLVHRMINVSSNLATNLLIELVSPDSVQATIRRLGAQRMEVLRGVEDLEAFKKGLNNTVTANDMARLLEAIARGEAVSPEADRRMVDMLQEQRFREMIPAGLPEGSRVAHKDGQITAIHHDAAIVYPSDEAPYVLVVLTEGFVQDSVSSAVGAEIARVVHDFLRR